MSAIAPTAGGERPWSDDRGDEPPDRVGKEHGAKRTNAVGLLMPEIVNSFYTTIVRGVEDMPSANGIHVLIGNTDADIAKEQSFLRVMMGIRVDGIVMAPAGSASPALLVLPDATGHIWRSND